MSEIKKIEDNDLKKISGGYSTNSDGTYSFEIGETFESTLQNGKHFFFEVQEPYPSRTLQQYVKVYFEETNDEGVFNNGVKILTVKEIFDTCGIEY